MWLVLALVVSYLLGSIPISVWLGKAIRGIDIREHGSGNAGATNALRVLGLKAGLLVMALDMTKGLVAVLLVSRIAEPSSAVDIDVTRVLTGGCAIMGHIFSIFLGFRGGKGVGTGAGVLFALAPIVTLCALILWAIIVAVTRYVSVASMAAAVCVPALMALQKLAFGNDPGRALMSLGVVLALVVLISHHANARRLLAGRENKIALGRSRSPRKSS
jgi:glycerol-3-phosphate acyltransferase PlsY